MSSKSSAQILFEQEIEKKYIVYNSLFANLPYDDMSILGSLTPMLYDLSKEKLGNNVNPEQIIQNFLKDYSHLTSEQEKKDLLFKLIQFIERQVVLFDSVEDASFDKLIDLQHQNGTLENLYQIAQQRKKLKQVKKELQEFKVRIVFTAHPTQFYPNAVLKIIFDLEQAIKENNISEIDSLLQQLGKTPFINSHKPTPLDEANSLIYYLRYVYYQSVGEVHKQLYSSFFEEKDSFIPVMELGFWPGGDRDGNPFVTAQITRQVTKNLRTAVLKCYYSDIRNLVRRLTFKGVSEKLESLSYEVYENMFALKSDITTEYIVESLSEIREILITKHDGIFLDLLDNFIRQVQTFKMHFASLDIRQDSSIHKKVMDAIVEKYLSENKKYSAMNESEKLTLLLDSTLLLDENDFDEEIVQDTIKNIKQIKEIQKENGETSIHRYIISNSTSIFQVLEVYAMFRFCGYKDSEINIDIIPLFETVEGLDNAEEVMERLYNLPLYKNHLQRRKKQQTIMLGFSDGTKDGGYLKANWGIFEAKEKLTNVSERNGYKVLFFDGRGGPPARGGGKTRQFYASQGPTIASHQIQLTIQGQTITSNYGSRSQAKHNFEQLITAGIMNKVFVDDSIKIAEKDRQIIHELSELSYQKYEDLKNHPQFVSYLEERSTVQYYGKTNIGSRPAKRGGADSGLQFSSLRAIPFVGSWSQLKQNVPGYFGFGSALKKFKDEGKIEELKNMYQNSLYFRTLAQNSMMSLMKCNFDLTSYMKSGDKFSDFWNILYDEYLLSKELLLEISQQKILMEDEEMHRYSIECREKIMLPLLIIQQYALKKTFEAKDDADKLLYEKMLVRTLYGIINGSRNSA